uniref:Reverse transcriptase domain-containing protein n=1 Tax=Cajanus cajan TaxID=3821 RepID=A0A151RHR3_CAJCA|nr:hypothetical protein KK1_036537 [Cajanus cajan]
MEKLVHPNQSSFVPQRNNKDNIIIAQEFIHSMRYKSGKIGWMVIKIDPKKYYDKSKWNLIKDTLADIGILHKFIELIWACIFIAKMCILIRQGDMISPYLFVLCMKHLFHLISFVIPHYLWKPICLSRGGPPLSHLTFVDDLVLFA